VAFALALILWLNVPDSPELATILIGLVVGITAALFRPEADSNPLSAPMLLTIALAAGGGFLGAQLFANMYGYERMALPGAAVAIVIYRLVARRSP
jgi:uncharacterized membrane protein YeaQ/YmgE (transglycosylase-associated protein family)